MAFISLQTLAKQALLDGDAMLTREAVTYEGWRQILVQLGHGRAVLAITLFSIVASVAITAILVAVLGLQNYDLVWIFLISAVVPAIVAPLASHLWVQLLFELDLAQKNLQRMASRDGLTQAYNRGYFMERLTIETQRARRLNEPLSLVMIDADNFKSINDRYGHAMGDQVLQEIARISGSILRVYDVFARLGGEEFVALLPSVKLAEAYLVAERIRRAIEALRVQTVAGPPISVTVSLGVSNLQPNELDGMKLLDRADRLLYEAKRAGRNRVV